MKPLCAVAGCERPVKELIWCHGHYSRQRRGAPLGGPFPEKPVPGEPMRCTRCNQTKPWEDFPNVGRARPGAKRTRCRTCASAIEVERQAQNRPAVRERYRRWYTSDLDRHRASARRRSPNHNRQAVPDPVKVRARSAVLTAMKAGTLLKPSVCSACGGAPGRIEAHHPDYAKPLEVMWLCSLCHGAEHRRELAAPVAEDTESVA